VGAILTRGGRNELPTPPAEIADEVEMYARESGRHAALIFVPVTIKHGRVTNGTWVINMTLRPDDKRMLLYQEQKVGDPPTEKIWLHKPSEDGTTYEPLDIHQLGASGVREFLDRGNMWSGRGEFSSLEEQVRWARDEEERRKQKNYDDSKQHSRDTAKDKRRTLLGISFLGVGIDLKKKGAQS